MAWLDSVKAVIAANAPNSRHVVMDGPAGDALRHPSKLAEILLDIVKNAT